MTFKQGTHQVAQKSIINGPSLVNSARDVFDPSNSLIFRSGIFFASIVVKKNNTNKKRIESL